MKRFKKFIASIVPQADYHYDDTSSTVSRSNMHPDPIVVKSLASLAFTNSTFRTRYEM